MPRESSSIIRVVLRPNKVQRIPAVNDSCRIGPNGELHRRDNATRACCQKQNKAECIVRQVKSITVYYLVRTTVSFGASLPAAGLVCDYTVVTRMVASCAWQDFAPRKKVQGEQSP